MSIIVDIPGYGEVEVDSEEDVAKLNKQLGDYAESARIANQELEKLPKEILKALGKIEESNKELVKTMLSQLSKLKPVIHVETPVVKYTPPDVKVSVPAPQVTVEAPAYEFIMPEMDSWEELEIEFDVLDRDANHLIKNAKMTARKIR